MKIKFDSDQEYQAKAVSAVVDAFDGQPVAAGSFEMDSFELLGATRTQLGYGNGLVLSAEQLLKNVRKVQDANGLKPSEALATTPSLIGEADVRGGVPHLSIEMETGTGKTYVYLRTVFELRQRFGFTKFIIVVPSVAIREGVNTSLDLTREHFAELYDNLPVDAWIYDSRQVSRLRQFAQSNQLQILIINIDAFNKKDIAVIFKESDRLSGRKPIDFIRATNPVVIIDEPQNMETDTAREAIKNLNPLCTLRYSATHRSTYNLMYRLGPVSAFNLKLVKRIEVDSVLEQGDFNRPFIHLEGVEARPIIKARLTIDVQTDKGPKRKTVTVKRRGEDLFELSKERAVYRGYIVDV